MSTLMYMQGQNYDRPSGLRFAKMLGRICERAEFKNKLTFIELYSYKPTFSIRGDAN